MVKVSTLDLMKHDGEVFVKVARKAEVGEKVVTIEHGCHGWPSGVIATREGARFKSDVETTLHGCGGQHSQYLEAERDYNVLVPLKSGATVTVSGEEYSVMGDGSTARVGDLVVAIDSWTDVDYGDVFEVKQNSWDDLVIVDNDDDERDLDCWYEETVTLRKVSATPKPEADDSDIVEYNGAKYRKVKRNVREGDKYIVALINDNGGDTKKGGIYAIDCIDSDGDPRFTDSVGDDDQYLCAGDYAVLEPIPVSIEEQIAETERKLAELKTSKAEQERQQAEAQRLKVGEFAVVVNDVMEYEVGDVIRISERLEKSRYFDFKVDRILANDYGYIHEKDLRRATPEEVVEAQAELAEEQAQKAERERWAAIGREVGEIRKGDIVRAVDATGGHPIGTIGTARYNGNIHSMAVEANGDFWYHGVELVTPVEQRFDRKDNVA